MASIRSRIGEDMEDRYLFKAKRIDDGEWIVGYLYRLSENNPPFIMLRKYGESYEVDEHTICQCTGLKDKNSRLIWENDVVEIGEHEDTVNGLYKVIYCENAHCYALKRSVDFHYNFFTFSDLNGFETSSKVIGNIFDNPELLESEG